MLKKRIPAYLTAVTFAAGALVGVLTMANGKRHGHPRSEPMQPASTVTAAASVEPEATYMFKRRGGYRFTKPLVYGEPVRPSPRLAPLADTLKQIIARHHAKGDLHSASVYVREFQRGEWTAVNGEEPYDPGSVLKIPVLIWYLQREHEMPGTLDQQVVAPCTERPQPGTTV